MFIVVETKLLPMNRTFWQREEGIECADYLSLVASLSKEKCDTRVRLRRNYRNQFALRIKHNRFIYRRIYFCSRTKHAENGDVPKHATIELPEPRNLIAGFSITLQNNSRHRDIKVE